MAKDFYKLSPEETLEQLSSSRKGLSEKEAQKRLARFGRNEIVFAQKLSNLKVLLYQFRSPLVIILLFAALATFLLSVFERESYFTDILVILIAVFVNTLIGFLQEKKANDAFRKLSSALKSEAVVLRDGQEKEIDAELVVPGDIIVLDIGRRVPADARIISCRDLRLNEAALTGEWLPVQKDSKSIRKDAALGDRRNMLFRGTTIESGQAVAVVVATGMRTEIGKVVQMLLGEKRTRSPLQLKIARLSRLISYLAIGIIVLMTFLGIFEGYGIERIFLLAIALAVAAIPEGLPIAITTILAICSRKILRQKGLVKKLLVAETLGAASVICLDKTGTLTEGKMKIGKILAFQDRVGSAKRKVFGASSLISNFALYIAALSSSAIVEESEEDFKSYRIKGDPTEVALMQGALDSGIDYREINRKYPVRARIPFDSRRNFQVFVRRLDKKRDIFLVSGAPERILALSTEYKTPKGKRRISEVQRVRQLRKISVLAAKGFRVIALGYKEVSRLKDINHLTDEEIIEKVKKIVFVAIVGLKDSLRDNVKESLDTARAAGLKTVIVTGDHKLTAKAIFGEIGLEADETQILEGVQLDKMSDEELFKKVEKVKIFARVSPGNKLRIVQAFQRHGEVVAMTGDGINDAPALRRADVGIALASGTDIAKDAADLVLLEDDFSTILSAIREGRIAFDNIRKIVLFLLSDGFTEIILVAGSFFLHLPLAILPVQILWVNLVEDSLPGFSFAFEPGDKDIMRRKPRRRDDEILGLREKFIIFFIGLTSDIILFIGFAIFFFRHLLSIDYIRTLIFVAISVDSIVYLVGIKSFRRPFWKERLFNNKFTLWSLAFIFAMILLAVYLPAMNQILKTVPLAPVSWLFVLSMILIEVALLEATKLIFLNRD